ncbi:MAG TPA: hypothetical protein VHR66_09365 [Gemmataceae bacterium]|jgi:hypothetical protein|nr:hypothetical protein [Gemmataceae bacterium]
MSSTFRFLPEEKSIVDTLIAAVRKVLARSDISARHVHYCGMLLHALQRLPLVTEEVGITFLLVKKYDSGQYWLGMTIDRERLELQTGESFYGECGTDNESKTIFAVSRDGRLEENDLETAQSWANDFLGHAEFEKVKVDFEDFGDSVADWDDDGDPDMWNELPVGYAEEED